jgi:hypothetical protein
MVHDLKHVRTLPLLAALQFAGFAGGAGLHAQDAATLQATAEGYAEASTPSPGDWNLRVPATALFGEITTEDKRVVGTFAGAVTPNIAWTASLSGLLDKNDASAPVRLADLNGLRNAATGALALTYEHWEPSAVAAAERKWCTTFWGSDANLPGPAKVRIAAINADATLSDEEKTSKRAVVVDSVARNNCVRSKIPPAHQAAFEAAGDVNYGRPFRLSAQVEGGMLDFAYVDTETGREIEGSRRPWAMSLSANYYVPSLRTLFALGGRVEKSHEAARETEYCTPIGTAGASQCRSAALAAPEEKEATIVQAEMRRFFTEFFGISPRVSRDLTDGVWGAELPILIRTRGDEGFQSGLIVGWRSDEEGVVVSAFIGKLFGLQAGP